MKQNNFVIIAAFFATVVICFPFPTEAAGKKPSSPDASSSTGADASPAAAAAPGGKVRATPFKGIIAAVDDKAKTFTIAGKETSHSLKITDKTIITRGGQPATMKDVVSNEEVRGSLISVACSSSPRAPNAFGARNPQLLAHHANFV